MFVSSSVQNQYVLYGNLYGWYYIAYNELSPIELSTMILLRYTNHTNVSNYTSG